MIRPIITAFVLLTMLGSASAQTQQPVSFKTFASFRQIVPEVDFFASNRQVIAPYERPISETIARLKTLFGPNIPRGAIFVCSTLKQKDSIYEPMVLKKGYGWTLTVITAQVRMQEMQARMESQMKGNIPPEIMARMKSRMPDMLANAEKQEAVTTAQQVAYAVIQSTLVKDLKFRSSRIEDVGKSPLPDWLDIGIAAYASGANGPVGFLQQNMDQTFPIEDVISMSRPFVASSSDQGSGSGGGMPRFAGGNGGGAGFGGMPSGMPQGMGQGMPQGMPQGMQMPQGMPQGMRQGGFSAGRNGGNGANGGQRGGQQRVLPKDEQDRMLFDGQASTLFSYLLEKIGIAKMKDLIKQAQEGKESREFFAQPDVLGNKFGSIEEDWTAWVKALKLPQNQGPGFPGQF